MARKIERHLLKIWSRCLFYFLNSQKKKGKKKKRRKHYGRSKKAWHEIKGMP